MVTRMTMPSSCSFISSRGLVPGTGLQAERARTRRAAALCIRVRILVIRPGIRNGESLRLFSLLHELPDGRLVSRLLGAIVRAVLQPLGQMAVAGDAAFG